MTSETVAMVSPIRWRDIVGQLGLPEELVSESLLQKVASEPLFLHHLQLCKHDPELLGLLMQEVPQKPATPISTATGIELVSRAGIALARWAASGFERVDRASYLARLEQCNACEHLSAPGGSRLLRLGHRASGGEQSVCALCGCDVKRKAWLATEYCPDGRWAEAAQ